MDIAITGSSGTIGTALVEAIEARGDQAVRVVRSSPGPDEIGWSPAEGTIDAGGFEGLDAVVHLAGALAQIEPAAVAGGKEALHLGRRIATCQRMVEAVERGHGASTEKYSGWRISNEE